MIDGLLILAIVLGVPLVLFGLLVGLWYFEESVVQPGERAAKVVEFLETAREPDEAEHRTAQYLAEIVQDVERESRSGVRA